MIIDCFIFFNELDLLEGRLEYLYDHVDWFVIVEGNITHTGKSKPLNFLKNISRYRSYLDKILYFPWTYDTTNMKFTSTEDPSNSNWQLENNQRNHIAEALKFFDHDDICLISDIDEVPNLDILSEAIKALEFAPAVSFDQKVLVYNLNRQQIGTWYGTVATKCGIVTSLSAQHCRDSRFFNMPHIKNGGWHLTYWGDANSIRTKLENFAHQEKNTPEYTDMELIEKRIRLGLHPLEPIELVHEGFTRSVPTIGLPQNFVDVFSKYQK